MVDLFKCQQFSVFENRKLIAASKWDYSDNVRFCFLSRKTTMANLGSHSVVAFDSVRSLGRELCSGETPVARLQKKVQVNLRYRVEQAISKTAPDATAGDNSGGFSDPSRLEEGGLVLGRVGQGRHLSCFWRHVFAQSDRDTNNNPEAS